MNGFAHNLEQMVVYAIVRCQHFTSTEIGIATAEVCHAASRLSNDKASGSHIPWSEESLDAPLGTPCRYIAQLYGCRAQQDRYFSWLRVITHYPTRSCRQT